MMTRWIIFAAVAVFLFWAFAKSMAPLAQTTAPLPDTQSY